MTQEVAKAINNVSKKVNDVESKLDTLIQILSTKNSADIDYLAMMADIDMDPSTDEEVSE